MSELCWHPAQSGKQTNRIRHKTPPLPMGGIALILVVLLLARSAGAQSTVGTIAGTVTDASGAVLVGVKVTVTNTGTSIARTVNTDETGNYKILRLSPGSYSIAAEISGFKKSAVTGIVLQVNQEARYDLRMEVGEVTQEVSVNAEGDVQVQTEDATLGQVVDQKKVIELPLNGRNFMQLITIGSGAAPIQNSGGGAITGETGGRQGLSFTVSGQREVSLSYLLDGVEAKSEFEQMVAIQPSLDSIQEFKLQRNAFSAEFGAASAVVNVSIKSGTNDLHGSLFEFLRNDALDSSQFQDAVVNGEKQKPPFRMNQFGGAIGGPVWIPKLYDGRNRTFWFVGYEGLRRSRFNSYTANAIPNRFRNGDFSTLKDATGNLIPIFDPLTYDPATGLRQQFPNNIIPSARLDPMAQKLLKYFPAPQNELAPPGTPNITIANNNTQNSDQLHVRIDHKISDKTNIFGRYSWFDSPLLNPIGYSPSSTVNYPLRDKNLAISVTHLFSPRSVNEFRFGYNQDRFDVVPNSDGTNVSQELGLKNINPVPQQYGIPNVGGVTFSGVGPYGWDIVSGGKLYQFTDVLTLIRGAHTLKVGGEVRNMRPWELAEDTGRRGDFSFSGDFTSQLGPGGQTQSGGIDIADFLLGIPLDSTGATGSTYTKFRWTNYHGFIQDEWKVRPDLTLSLGLRYEYDEMPKPEDGKLAAWCSDCVVDGFLGDLLRTDKPNSGGRILPPGVRYEDKNNFAPRVGFAWSPFGTNKNTVLRGGFGIFYENTKGDEMNFEQHHPDKIRLISIRNENPRPSFGLKDAFPAAPESFNPDPFVTDPQDRWPYVTQWNMNVQHKFAKDWLLEVGYVGSHGNKLSKRWPINQARLDKDPNNPTPVSSRVPYPRFGAPLGSFKSAIANYNAMQLRIEKSFSHGLYVLSGYTFSRCQDMDSSASFAADTQNVYDQRNGDYGLCGFQIQNRANFSFGWELPFGKGLTGAKGKLLKGWQVNSIAQFQDGTPFTITASGLGANVGAWTTTRGNRTCDGNLPDSQQTVTKFFDTSCFQTPPVGTFGNAGRNTVFSPGYKSVDFSLFKNTHISERTYVQFRAEFFNAFNHSNYNRPGNRIGAFSFGRITGETDAREIQFGLKILF